MDILDNLFEDVNTQNNKISGIITGIVKEIYDEKFPGMVKVEFFMGDGKLNVSDWIRVIVPYGGKDKGMYFLPDIGDEVAIAFENGDIEKPYLLGCLWSKVDKIPDKTVTKDNSIKKIKTKGGHEIIFDDTSEKSKLSIITPAKSEIVIDDEKSTISIMAKGDNGQDIIKIDSKKNEISIKANKKIILDAGSSSIKLDGQGKKIDITSDNITLDGKTVKIKGQSMNIQGSQTEIKAAAAMNIKSDAVVNLKGAMVKIN